MKCAGCRHALHAGTINPHLFPKGNKCGFLFLDCLHLTVIMGKRASQKLHAYGQIHKAAAEKYGFYHLAGLPRKTIAQLSAIIMRTSVCSSRFGRPLNAVLLSAPKRPSPRKLIPLSASCSLRSFRLSRPTPYLFPHRGKCRSLIFQDFNKSL